jgi:hypothetical protein
MKMLKNHIFAQYPYSMKKSLLFVILFFLTSRLFAQDCSQNIFMQKGRVIEVTTHGPDGTVQSKTVRTIDDVTNANGYTIASITAEVFDAGGTLKKKNTLYYQCNGTLFAVDVSSLMPQSGNVKVAPVYLEYPAVISVGDNLPNLTKKFSITADNRTYLANLKFYDRTVKARETITTPSGTYECYKNTYRILVTYSGSSQPPPAITSENTEWYSPKFGVVKSESSGLTRELTSVK